MEAYQRAIDSGHSDVASRARLIWCAPEHTEESTWQRKPTNRPSIPDIPKLRLRECAISEGCL